uniref:Transposase Tc1-like domain-containing protein n=1 Tax=Oryzias latipes TaxID=8090 RepID=A0A3P9LTV1_ORYLA
ITTVRSKKLPETLKKKIVAAYESGKGFKKKKNSKEFDISNSTIRKIVYKWRTIKTVTIIPSKFNPRSDRMMLKEVTNNPKISSQDLQQTFRLHKFDVHGRCARRKSLLSKANIKARLKFRTSTPELGADSTAARPIQASVSPTVRQRPGNNHPLAQQTPTTELEAKTQQPSSRGVGGIESTQSRSPRQGRGPTLRRLGRYQMP